MSMHVHSGAAAPIFQAPIPPKVVIPSTDFGGPILSLFDPLDDDLPIVLADDGLPAEVIDVMAALEVIAASLKARADRDAQAILWPGEPYASPRSPERWLQELDQTMADLAVCRARLAREINAE